MAQHRERERDMVPNAGMQVASPGYYNPNPGGRVPVPSFPGLGSASGALSGVIMGAQHAAQQKINRELFVGNTPQGTSEMLLLQFLNGAMRRANLCGPTETPILNCRVNTKFAFIELSAAELANKALNLNGIPFLGAILKVSRPSKYAGPHVPSQTWQQLTGQSVPVINNNDIGGGGGGGGGTGGGDRDKINRELFVGNTTPAMTEAFLTDFLGNAMEQVGLNTKPGNPIAACRVSGKFAFIELRSPQEAANALNLNNIPCMGAYLRIGRPSKWSGTPDTHGNWEDILAKYMSGELQVGAAASSSVTTRVVELHNMLTSEDLEDENEYNEIMEDTRAECGQFGTLKSIVIPKANEPGATKIFLEYESPDDAAKAIQNLAGRTFDGRKVAAAYFDEGKFASKQFA